MPRPSDSITDVVSFPSRVLVVLADEMGRRVLPAWLSPLEGLPLAAPPTTPASSGSPRGMPYELAAKVLAAAGGAVRAVRIGELNDRLFGSSSSPGLRATAK